MPFGEATMRLSTSFDRAEEEALIAAYKRVALAELRRSVGPADWHG
jgi:hypothetical protein